MPLRLTDDEVAERLWEVAKALGHSRAELDGMLDKGRTPREVLRRLETRYRSAVARAEREGNKLWHKEHAAERSEVFAREQALNEKRLRDFRSRQTLGDRVQVVVTEAAMVQEGTRATALDGKISMGEKTPPMPTLDGRPLVEELRELLEAAIERAEAEIDFVVRSLPRLDWAARNSAILKTEGPAEIVALRFGVSESHVRKLRASSGKVPRTGRPARQERSEATA